MFAGLAGLGGLAGGIGQQQRSPDPFGSRAELFGGYDPELRMNVGSISPRVRYKPTLDHDPVIDALQYEVDEWLEDTI